MEARELRYENWVLYQGKPRQVIKIEPEKGADGWVLCDFWLSKIGGLDYQIGLGKATIKLYPAEIKWIPNEKI